MFFNVRLCIFASIVMLLAVAACAPTAPAAPGETPPGDAIRVDPQPVAATAIAQPLPTPTDVGPELTRQDPPQGSEAATASPIEPEATAPHGAATESDGNADQSASEDTTSLSNRLQCFDAPEGGVTVPLVAAHDLPPLPQPPKRPPETRLIAETSEASSSDGESLGALAFYRWLIDGEEVQQEPKLPFEWPAALVISQGHILVIDLGTSIAPAEIELGLFRELETDGSPAVDDAFREFSCDTTNNGYEVNRHMETNPVLDDGEHWQLLAPALDEPGPYYLIIRANWADPEVDSNDPVARMRAKFDSPYLAGWALTAQRE